MTFDEWHGLVSSYSRREYPTRGKTTLTACEGIRDAPEAVFVLIVVDEHLDQTIALYADELASADSHIPRWISATFIEKMSSVLAPLERAWSEEDDGYEQEYGGDEDYGDDWQGES